jgi:hypothetical protein
MEPHIRADHIDRDADVPGFQPDFVTDRFVRIEARFPAKAVPRKCVDGQGAVQALHAEAGAIAAQHAIWLRVTAHREGSFFLA